MSSSDDGYSEDEDFEEEFEDLTDLAAVDSPEKSPSSSSSGGSSVEAREQNQNFQQINDDEGNASRAVLSPTTGKKEERLSATSEGQTPKPDNWAFDANLRQQVWAKILESTSKDEEGAGKKTNPVTEKVPDDVLTVPKPTNPVSKKNWSGFGAKRRSSKSTQEIIEPGDTCRDKKQITKGTTTSVVANRNKMRKKLRYREVVKKRKNSVPSNPARNSFPQIGNNSSSHPQLHNFLSKRSQPSPSLSSLHLSNNGSTKSMQSPISPIKNITSTSSMGQSGCNNIISDAVRRVHSAVNEKERKLVAKERALYACEEALVAREAAVAARELALSRKLEQYGFKDDTERIGINLTASKTAGTLMVPNNNGLDDSSEDESSNKCDGGVSEPTLIDPESLSSKLLHFQSSSNRAMSGPIPMNENGEQMLSQASNLGLTTKPNITKKLKYAHRAYGKPFKRDLRSGKKKYSALYSTQRPTLPKIR